MLTFTNPRTEATFADWPLGRDKRGQCTFKIENGGKKGYRAVRQTFGKPKAHTYAGRAVIVDGSNGRTYIVQDVPNYGFIKVVRSDFMDASPDELGFDSVVVPRHGEIWITLMLLIDQAYPD